MTVQGLRPCLDATGWLTDHAGVSIDELSGSAFEMCLASMFRALNYDVELTGMYDYGADLVVTKDGLRSAVQGKRHDGRVGDHPVQQVIGGRAYYHCDTATVVTNSEVTPRARALAEANAVTIIDRAHFTRMLQMAGLIEAPILLPAPRCRRCDLALVRRSGRFGPFWGCPNYGPQKCRSHEEFRYTLVVAAHVGGLRGYGINGTLP